MRERRKGGTRAPNPLIVPTHHEHLAELRPISVVSVIVYIITKIGNLVTMLGRGRSYMVMTLIFHHIELYVLSRHK